MLVQTYSLISLFSIKHSMLLLSCYFVSTLVLFTIPLENEKKKQTEKCTHPNFAQNLFSDICIYKMKEIK